MHINTVDEFEITSSVFKLLTMLAKLGYTIDIDLKNPQTSDCIGQNNSDFDCSLIYDISADGDNQGQITAPEGIALQKQCIYCPPKYGDGTETSDSAYSDIQQHVSDESEHINELEVMNQEHDMSNVCWSKSQLLIAASYLKELATNGDAEGICVLLQKPFSSYVKAFKPPKHYANRNFRDAMKDVDPDFKESKYVFDMYLGHIGHVPIYIGAIVDPRQQAVKEQEWMRFIVTQPGLAYVRMLLQYDFVKDIYYYCPAKTILVIKREKGNAYGSTTKCTKAGKCRKQ